MSLTLRLGRNIFRTTFEPKCARCNTRSKMLLFSSPNLHPVQSVWRWSGLQFQSFFFSLLVFQIALFYQSLLRHVTGASDYDLCVWISPHLCVQCTTTINNSRKCIKSRMQLQSAPSPEGRSVVFLVQDLINFWKYNLNKASKNKFDVRVVSAFGWKKNLFFNLKKGLQNQPHPVQNTMLSILWSWSTRWLWSSQLIFNFKHVLHLGRCPREEQAQVHLINVQTHRNFTQQCVMIPDERGW